MYFYVSNLSLLDLCFTTSTVPQMLVNLWDQKRPSTIVVVFASSIFPWPWVLQIHTSSHPMAFDRYAAIFKPQHQSSWTRDAVSTWPLGPGLVAFANSLVQSTLTVLTPRCGQGVMDHFFCRVPALLKLACADTHVNEAELNVLGALLLLVPPLPHPGKRLCVHCRAVIRIRSAESRWKAFNTCASHFISDTLSSALQPSLCMSSLPLAYSRDREDHALFLWNTSHPHKSIYLYTEEQGCQNCP